MNIRPSLEEIKELEEDKNYDIVPVSTEILSDFITPIEALKKLMKVSNHCFLLESVTKEEHFGRYTFLGYNPKMEITIKDEIMHIGPETLKTDEPDFHIRKLLNKYRSPTLDYLPSFTGGFVGYFSYDYLFYREPKAKVPVRDENEFKDLDIMLFDKVIAFDNLKQKIILIVNIPLKDIDANYKEAKTELENIIELLKKGRPIKETGGTLTGEIEPLFQKKEFCQMVEEAKNYIREGDIFQVVLSNRFSGDYNGSLLNVYRQLRTINPSPYMFYFSGTDVEVAGASPETLVKLEDDTLYTFPLAGTRPRGKTKEEDELLEKELLKDAKELAEHDMLVDLGRNDLGRICEFGTVEVEKLHEIERYSHVMHIGSTIRGKIKKDKDGLDAIASVLPAGTLSGAPKIRACQIIGELENCKRGIYGGAIGYIAFNGNMDTCIAIRLAYKKNGKVFIRSGAGIVADSVAENEFVEVKNKAGAVVKSLNEAQNL